jgi:WD40 repeat protein
MPQAFDGPQLSTPGGPTRRGFIKTACISAAGAAMLEGCARGKIAQRGVVRDTNSDSAQLVQQREKARALEHVHVHRPTSVAVISNAEAVTCDDDGALIKWDIRTVGAATKVREFAKHHNGKASYLAVDRNHGRALTSGFDGTVIIHSLGTPLAQAPPTFIGHRADGRNPEVWVVTVSRDGRFALSATNDGQILLWEVANPAGGFIAFKYSNAAVAGLAFVPRGIGGRETHFLSTHSRGQINLWDLQPVLAQIAQNREHAFGPKNPVRTTPVQIFEHGNKHYVNAVAVTEDGRRFLSAGFDKTVCVWDLPANLPVAQPGGAGVAAAPAAPDAVRAGSQDAGGRAGGQGGGQPQIRIPGKVAAAPNPNPPRVVFQHKANVWRLALRGTDVAASASNDGTAVLFDHRKTRHIMTFDTLPKDGPKKEGGGVMGVAFTQDGRIVYTGISDEHAPLASRPVIVQGR